MGFGLRDESALWQKRRLALSCPQGQRASPKMAIAADNTRPRSTPLTLYKQRPIDASIIHPEPEVTVSS
jgi:hypothetical protein